VILYRSGALRPMAGAEPQSMAAWPVLDIIDNGERLVLQIDQRAAGGPIVALALDRVTALDVLDVLRVGLDLSLGELVDELHHRLVDIDDGTSVPRDVETVETGHLL
jgi:hypothetical protein